MRCKVFCIMGSCVLLCGWVSDATLPDEKTADSPSRQRSVSTHSVRDADVQAMWQRFKAQTPADQYRKLQKQAEATLKREEEKKDARAQEAVRRILAH